MSEIQCTPKQAARFEELKQQALADTKNHAIKTIRVTDSRINKALELYQKYESKQMICKTLRMSHKTLNKILEKAGVSA